MLAYYYNAIITSTFFPKKLQEITSVPRKSNRNGRNDQRKTLNIYDLRFTIWKVSALRAEGEAEPVRGGTLEMMMR